MTHPATPSQPLPEKNVRRFTEANYFEQDLFLMVDERLIVESQGAHYEFCPLVKHGEPVLRPTARCEGGDGENALRVHGDPFVGSVLWDAVEERYVAWYRSNRRDIGEAVYSIRGEGAILTNKGRDGSQLYMAYSKDGVHWERPELGAVLFEGSYRNNLIPDTPGPVLQEHANSIVPSYLDDGKGELVVSVYSKFADPIYPYGITHMRSADGVSWQPHYPPPLPLDGDAHCLMWDPKSQCYLCTTRSAQHSRIVRRMQLQGFPDRRNKRHVALAKSRDLVHWTPMLDILEADEQDPESMELYTMYILPYGNLYLGFIETFHMQRQETRGPLEMQLAISYDLENWHRAGQRQPILPRGAAGEWDSGHVRLMESTPFPEGNQLRFWYGGKDTEHWQCGDAAIGTATLRRDGFGCWSAGPDGGSITTVLFRIEWAARITLNVDATEGEVRLELLDEDGKTIEGCGVDDCQPITGDHLRATVCFGKRYGTCVMRSGKVRFRFHLRNAKLYAFRASNTFVAEGAAANGASGTNFWL